MKLRLLAWLAVLIAPGGCAPDRSTFADFPGFAAYYARHPPLTTTPTARERELLERHRPRVFLARGAEGPIDFYRDYIAHGILRDEHGKILAREVGPERLNSVRHTLASFTHVPPGTPPRPAVYGRVDRERFELAGRARAFTFLTYTLVFRHSGIPAGLTGVRELALGVVADLDDWHQLDHYTALTLALDEDLRPRAALFQQHNYMRSYVLAESEGPGFLVLPPDGRLAIDVAVRSNELYPHRPGRAERRAVSFLDPATARYLVLGEAKPSLAASDVTDPAREIDPPLAYLAPSDAFYTFRGWLGERRRLPGRDGPPGADFNTLPALKERWMQMIVFHWWEGDRAFVERISAADGGLRGYSQQAIEAFARRFAARLAGGDSAR